MLHHILWSNYLSVNVWCGLLFLEVQDRSVVITVRYVLNGAGIESRWKRHFHFQTGTEPHPGPIHWEPGFSRLVKQTS